MKDKVIGFFKALSRQIPKKRGLWLFGSWEGRNYSDNSKYMFEFVNAFHPEIEAVWMTKDRKVLKQTRARGFKCFHKWSALGIWNAMRAEVAFETESDGDISSFMNKTVVIQLFHGLGVKAFRWINDNGVPMYSDDLIKPHRESYWMASSSLYKETCMNLLGIPENHIYITGYPRTDVIARNIYNKDYDRYRKIYKNKRLIIYMPTHRNFGQISNRMILPDELLKLDAILSNTDIHLFIKLHYHEMSNLKTMSNKLTNITIFDNSSLFADVYSYVHFFDGLISDYSTILYEFAITGKPIVMFPFDIEEYKKQDSGLLDTYWDYPVGPMCYTWEEVIVALNGLFENDDWKDKRKMAAKVWHSFDDGKNCDRVYNAVLDILNKESN